MYAVITGASSGIGKELAFKLAERNYNLILVARRKPLLESLKQNLLDKFDKLDIIVLALDLSILSNCLSLFDTVKSFDINLFFNNAGFGQIGYSFEINDDKELQMIDLNTKSLHYLTKLFIKTFKKGLVVNVSSMAAFLPTPMMASYAATKSYVFNYSLALNYELKKSNSKVRVLTVAPGPVKTEFADVANAKQMMKGMPADKCAKLIVKGVFKNKKLIIPGFKMKFLYFIIRFIPKSILLRSAYSIQSKK